MTEILAIFISIPALFLALLVVKAVFRLKVCAMCGSVALTWLWAVAAYWFGAFHNPILIAVLLGQSAVGLYYLAEKHVQEKFQVFRLPFLLTLTFAAYIAVGLRESLSRVAALLAVYWAVCAALYIYRTNRHVQKLFNSVIACCRDW